MLRDAAEPGGADALAGEALGLVGGDFGGAGENLGQQVQQMRAFLVAEGGQDALLQGAYAGEQLVGGGAAVRGDLDQGAAPVIGIRDAADPAAVFEQVAAVERSGVTLDPDPDKALVRGDLLIQAYRRPRIRSFHK